MSYIIKIGFIGDCNVGKTSIINKYLIYRSRITNLQVTTLTFTMSRGNPSCHSPEETLHRRATSSRRPSRGSTG